MLQWHPQGGTWTFYDNPPATVHGVACIRATGPNICVFAQDGRLTLQIGTLQHRFAGPAPRLRFTRTPFGLGFHRRFRVQSEDGETLFNHGYWSAERRDFFRWLAAAASSPAWPEALAQRWSAGVPSPELP